MKKAMILALMTAALFASGLQAQDLAGDWQGTIHPNGKDVRILVRLAKGEKAGWSGTMYNVDVAGQSLKASSVVLDGKIFKFLVETMSITFEGKLSGDAKTIAGTWTQGNTPQPLILVRATAETAWEIPAAPAAVKPMAADADPAFEVATIKPNVSGEANLRQLTMNGRNFVLKNGSLGDLVGFAYNVQKNQIVNGPEWVDKDRYDIAGVPDVEGAPDVEQLRMMIRKLLADRYKMTFHHEKRDLPAYVLSTGKAGKKLTASEATGSLPNIGVRGAPNGLKLMLGNATVTDFASFLQMMVLDRPVVDQTGVVGRYDLSVTFMPDDSQFNGHPPRAPQLAEGVEPAPSLYDAVEQQLGLKLAQQKAPVDVIVVDHVERPSAN